MKFKSKLALLIMVASGYALVAGAQQAPEFMVTWKSGNYAPADYQGKIFPINSSTLEVAMELIDNGRLADLSANTIRWNVNGEFYKSGQGLKVISFTADGAKGDQTADISLTYRGKSLDKRVIIQLARPEVVITGGPDIFQALLYFFNLSSPAQAKFTWTVNNASVEASGQNPDVLALSGSVPSGSDLNIRVDIQNLMKTLETAAGSIQFKK